MTDFEAGLRVRTDAAVLDLTGTLNRAAEDRFTTMFEQALAATAGPVVLNFTDIGFINSTGIALVVGALAKARTAGRDVVAYGLDDHYRHIFEITRLVDFIGIFDDEADALRPREGHHA